MARGLMLKAATVDQTGDGTAYPSEASKKGWQQTGQMPAVAIAPFLSIGV